MKCMSNFLPMGFPTRKNLPTQAMTPQSPSSAGKKGSAKNIQFYVLPGLSRLYLANVAKSPSPSLAGQAVTVDWANSVGNVIYYYFPPYFIQWFLTHLKIYCLPHFHMVDYVGDSTLTVQVLLRKRCYVYTACPLGRLFLLNKGLLNIYARSTPCNKYLP